MDKAAPRFSCSLFVRSFVQTLIGDLLPSLPTIKAAFSQPACMVWRDFREFLLAGFGTGCPIR